ncbi:MAG: YkgJ family cysteine cluster protein [Thermoplasmata archaeon]|nr:YkgJ family cysteine cluster protein [Thermoplasmata archaeon]
MADPSLSLNTTLLRGFRYACWPECGLCCFAEPRVDATERAVLLQIAPETEFVDTSQGSFLRAGSNGGACQFLRNLRCSAHTARPHPCQEFPVHVHLGDRLQASLVLSCPGVALDVLSETTPFSARAAPEGFGDELAAVNRRLVPGVDRRLREAGRRKGRIVRQLDREGRWEEEEEVRDALRREVPLPLPEDFPVEAPPSAEDGLEFLPIFYDGRPGPVGLAEGLGGWEAVELRPSGGVERLLAAIPPPETPPELTPTAERLLVGYLRYYLERDALLASVLPQMLQSSEGTVTAWVAKELRTIGATVVSRALVRAKLSGAPSGPLRVGEIAEGIRATDQDRLDVPTWGDRL